jgi:D-psicose/D-tagatose/L-ribulose 3-epimerase
VKIGMNMLLWTADVTEEHYPLMAELKAGGFDGVELMLNPERGTAHREALSAELDQMALGRTVVFAPDESANPISPDPAVREAAVERLVWAVRSTAEVGSSILAGPFHTAYPVFSGEPATEDERAWCAEVMRAGAEEGERCGVTLTAEILNRFECYLLNTVSDGLDMVERVGHPRFKIHYDTHHAHIEEQDPGAAIRAGAGAIGHVHISESDRGVPGRGQVNWDASFDALKEIGYDGWLVIEAFSRNDPGFANAIHVWRDFAPSDEIWREGLSFIKTSWSA